MVRSLEIKDIKEYLNTSSEYNYDEFFKYLVENDPDYANYTANDFKDSKSEAYQKAIQLFANLPEDTKDTWRLFNPVGAIHYDYTKEPHEQDGDPIQQKKARNNALVDLYFGMLTSPAAASKVLNPGGFLDQKAAAAFRRTLDNLSLDALQSPYEGDKSITVYDFIKRTYLDPNISSPAKQKMFDSLIAKTKEVDSPISASVWAKNRARIASSGESIGIAANQNVTHALLQKTQMVIKEGASFKLNGKSYTNLHAITNDEGDIISKNNSEYVDACVDDVKYPTLGDTNFNTFTGDVIMFLSSLGYTKPEITLLLTQPVVRRATQLFFEASTEGVSKKTAIELAIKEYADLGNVRDISYDSYKKWNFNNEDLMDFIIMDRKVNEVEGANFTTNYELNNGDFKDKSDAEKYAITKQLSIKSQVAVGALFSHIFNMSNKYADIVRFCKADTNNGAAGPDIATTMSKVALAAQIVEESTSDRYPFAGMTFRTSDNSPEIPIVQVGLCRRDNFDVDEVRAKLLASPLAKTQANYTFGIEMGSQLFAPYFPYYKDSLQNPVTGILARLRALTKTKKIDTRLENKVYNAAALYFLTGYKENGVGLFDTYGDVNGVLWQVGAKEIKDREGNVIYKNENGLSAGEIFSKWLYDFPQYVKIMKTFDGEYPRALADNAFFSRIRYVDPTEKNPIPSIVFRNVGYLNNHSKWLFGNYFLDMVIGHHPLPSDKGNITYDAWSKQFARQLFIYNGLRTGFDFGPNSFVHLANTLFRKEVDPRYVNGLRSMLSSPDLELDETFYKQFVYNNLHERSICPEIKIEAVPTAKAADDSYLLNSFEVTLTNDLHSPEINKLYKKDFDRTVDDLHDYICITKDGKDYYYEKSYIKDNGEKVIYTQVTPYGVKYECMIYYRPEKGQDLNSLNLVNATNPAALDQFTGKKSTEFVHYYSQNSKVTRQMAANDSTTLYVFTDNTNRTSGKLEVNPNSEYAKKYANGRTLHYPEFQTLAVLRGLDNSMPLSTQRYYDPANGLTREAGRWKLGITGVDDATTLQEFANTIQDEVNSIIAKWNTGKYKRIMLPIDEEGNIVKSDISGISESYFGVILNNELHRLINTIEGTGKYKLEDTQSLVDNYQPEQSSSMDNTANAPVRSDTAQPAPSVRNPINAATIPVAQAASAQAKQYLNIYAGTNENADLSNFAERPFTITNVGPEADAPINGTFKTVEGAFQAQKLAYSSLTDSEIEVIRKQLETASGAQARAIGRKISGLDIKAWDRTSSSLMKNLLKASFEQNPQALQRLLSTGNAILTHIQDKGKWGKEFPKLLMEVREELKSTAQRAPIVTRVISGAQTGVDTLGLEIANSLGISTGGTTTPNFVRESGIDQHTRQSLESLGVREITPELQNNKSGKEFYLPRTEQNVLNSDGTVYFFKEGATAGYYTTKRYADQHGKPFVANPTAEQLRQWILSNHISVLNVAGNRGSKVTQDLYNYVNDVLRNGLLSEAVTQPEQTAPNEPQENLCVGKVLSNQQVAKQLGGVSNVQF